MRSLSFSGRRYNRAKNKANDGGKGTPEATAKPDETQPELKIGEEPKGTAPHFEGWLSTADELAEQHGV